MDVLTEQASRARVRIAGPSLYLSAAALVYAAIVFAAALHHEPWADEAQSWLLARDATLLDLWTRLLHYEGTTGLWQTLLHLLICAGLPYSGMNLVSALLGVAAACVWLWRSPLPLPIRLALPFTFFLCYQYQVIARSYDLLPLLLFGCAAIYSRAAERPTPFTVLLCLIAAVSVHGMALASAIGLSALLQSPRSKPFALHAVLFAVAIVLLTSAAWPAPDGTFIAGLNLSFDHFLQVTAKALATAFTGEWITSLVVLALSLPLLWRGGGWLFLALSFLFLCIVDAVIYAQVWHFGVLFLAWLFALWISWPRTTLPSPKLLTLIALTMVIAVQGYWTACSLSYDWQHPYSGSLQAAQELRDLHLQNQPIYAIGFACVAIQPYFPRNIFANFNDGRPEAYWDWSRRNHVNQDSLHLAQSRPGYVIVGYKNEFERGVWTDLVQKSGYRPLRHFAGDTFWQTRILEPESYDLYQRSDAP